MKDLTDILTSQQLLMQTLIIVTLLLNFIGAFAAAFEGKTNLTMIHTNIVISCTAIILFGISYTSLILIIVFTIICYKASSYTIL